MKLIYTITAWFLDHAPALCLGIVIGLGIGLYLGVQVGYEMATADGRFSEPVAEVE